MTITVPQGVAVFSPDERYVITSDEHAVLIFETGTLQLLSTTPARAFWLAGSPGRLALGHQHH